MREDTIGVQESVRASTVSETSDDLPNIVDAEGVGADAARNLDHGQEAVRV